MGFQNYSILKVAFLTPNGAGSQTNGLKGLKNIMAINDIFSPRWSNLFWDTEPLYKCLVYTVKSLMVGVFPQWEIQLSCCKWDKELVLLSTLPPTPPIYQHETIVLHTMCATLKLMILGYISAVS